jgi:hypothetical protein
VKGALAQLVLLLLLAVGGVGITRVVVAVVVCLQRQQVCLRQQEGEEVEVGV